MRKQKLLLISDVEDVGRSGDIVAVRKGYARNFLVPKKLAIAASRSTVILQEQLIAERVKRAAQEKETAEQLAQKLTEVVLETKVKVDPAGHLYGSVTAFDISTMLKERGFKVEKRHVTLLQPIKVTGTHKVALKLEEGVPAEVVLEVISE